MTKELDQLVDNNNIESAKKRLNNDIKEQKSMDSNDSFSLGSFSDSKNSLEEEKISFIDEQNFG